MRASLGPSGENQTVDSRLLRVLQVAPVSLSKLQFVALYRRVERWPNKRNVGYGRSILKETIRMGAIELRFLQTKEATDASLDVFEITLQPDGRMPVPHYHESWDETVYGLAGTMTWNVEVGISNLLQTIPSSLNAASFTAFPTGAANRRLAFVS